MEATVRMEMFRQIEQCDHHKLLFPTGIESEWGSDNAVKKGKKSVSPYSLARSLAFSSPSRSSKHHDEDFMRSFLKNSKLNSLVYSNTFRKDAILPNSCSILDFIAADSKRIDSWVTSASNSEIDIVDEISRTRGLSLDLLDRVEVREIVIGKTEGSLVNDIAKWASMMHKRDNNRCPVGAMSMDVEELKVHVSDFEEIMQKSKSSSTSKIRIRRKFYEKAPCKQLPVKMMLGNGYSWAVMITVEVTPMRNQPDYFEVTPIAFQPELLDFLRDCPLFVGVGIRSDVEEMEILIRKISDPSFKFAGCTDLSSLAVLCGYNFSHFNMQALAVQLFGAFLNKSVSVGDHKWGYLWKDIPAPLKVYCIGDVKFGYQAVVLLCTVLLRDLFPDPDVVLSFCRRSGIEFMSWFCAWTLVSLQNVEVVPSVLSQATTRAEAIDALRIRLSDGTLSDAPPSRVLLFQKLLGDWPTVVFGGCRYLHQARYWWWQQVRILEESKPPGWKEKIMPYEVDDEMREAATFGIPGLAALDFHRSLPEAAPLGLGLHPDLAHRVVSVPMDQFSHKAVQVVSRKFYRIRREVAYEYIRLHLSELPELWVRISGDPYFMRYLRSYYCEARMIYLRCTGAPAPRSPELETEILRRQEHDILQEKTQLDALKKRVRLRKLRLSIMKDQRGNMGDAPCKLSWRARIPELSKGQVCSRKKGSRQDYEPTEYLREADLQDAAPVNSSVTTFMEEDEFDFQTEVSRPSASRRSKKKPRLCMGDPGFCDYEMVLDDGSLELEVELSSDGYNF